MLNGRNEQDPIVDVTADENSPDVGYATPTPGVGASSTVVTAVDDGYSNAPPDDAHDVKDYASVLTGMSRRCFVTSVTPPGNATPGSATRASNTWLTQPTDDSWSTQPAEGDDGEWNRGCIQDSTSQNDGNGFI